MPLPPKVQKEYDRLRPKFVSTRIALWYARVSVRFDELRAAGLLDFRWEWDSDFDSELWIKEGDTEQEINKRRKDLVRGRWEVKCLHVWLIRPETQEEFNWNSLSWIFLPRKSKAWNRQDGNHLEEMYLLEVAADVEDFWIYHPDPLVQLRNEWERRKK